MGTGEVLTIIGGALTTAIGWAFGRKSERAKIQKSDAEADGIAVASSERAVLIWERRNKELDNELKVLRHEMEEIRSQNTQLQIKMAEFGSQNAQLHKENVELKEQVRVLSGRVEELEGLTR